MITTLLFHLYKSIFGIITYGRNYTLLHITTLKIDIICPFNDVNVCTLTV